MPRISTSIIHLIGFVVVLLFSLMVFARTAIIGTDGTMNKVLALVTHRDPLALTCQITDPVSNRLLPSGYDGNTAQIIGNYQDDPGEVIIAEKKDKEWDINKIDTSTNTVTPVKHDIGFTGSHLSVTHQPVYDQIVFPECADNTCKIIIWSMSGNQEIASFTPIDSSGVSRTDIDNLFFDAENGIISYTTPSRDASSRLVVDFSGKLLQSIDESPGDDRQLTFKGYDPVSKMLVYTDNKTELTYFYGADSIFLGRRRCPSI